MIRLLCNALALGGMAAAVSAATAFPEAPPEVPTPDRSFLRQGVPAAAMVRLPGSPAPSARWDRDEDGFAELWGEWDADSDDFGEWTLYDPVTELPIWRMKLTHWLQAPWTLSWDVDGDGILSWTAIDADRDEHPEEVLWEISGESNQSARFLDRDRDGQFEVRCWIDLDAQSAGESGGHLWAFDDDGDGIYEREADGSGLTENGYDPDWAMQALQEEPEREDLRWELLGWAEKTGDDALWQDQVLAYVADPDAMRMYRLTYRPTMRRIFHSDSDFQTQLIDALTVRCRAPRAEYVNLWTLGEVLRWAAAPPVVNPAYLAQWRQELGLSAEASVPDAVSPEAAARSDEWFRRSLAREQVTRAARENVALRLAMLHGAQGNWELVEALCSAMLRDAERREGPISARHRELAAICFAYGNNQRAQQLYGAMAAHWQVRPGDPGRAQPNHEALIRLGIIALQRGNAQQARYFLLRALDSLSPEIEEPDTRLAELLLEEEGTRAAAEEYLAAIAARSEAGSGPNTGP